MVDIIGLADIPLPSFGGLGSVIIIFAIFLFAISGMVIIWVVYQWRIYNKKIIVFENVSGQGFQPILKDKARSVKLGAGGEELLYLKKKKVFRTAYGRKMGKNTYWFAVGQDGYWYNVILGDVDAKMGMLDIDPIDRDVRYMHVAIRKNIQDTYKQKKVLTATAIVVGGIVLTVLILLIGIWFLLDQIGGIAGQVAGSVESAKDVQEATRQIISGLDKLTTTSGVVSTT